MSKQKGYSIIMGLVVCTLLAGCLAGETVKPQTHRPVKPQTHRPVKPVTRMLAPSNKPVISKPCIKRNRPAIVAVIDTGLTLSHNDRICKMGHKDFTGTGVMMDLEKSKTGRHIDGKPNTTIKVPVDNHGHGTNIAGLIYKSAGEKIDYCMVILKYYDPNGNNLDSTVKAINYANNIGVDYINYSGGGIEFSPQEQAAVKKFLDRGGIFISAAGNESSDIDELAYYPAKSDPRVISVGNKTSDGYIAPTSNYGKSVTRWEYGTNQVGFGHMMTGTSQATANATGKILKENECEK